MTCRNDDPWIEHDRCCTRHCSFEFSDRRIRRQACIDDLMMVDLKQPFKQGETVPVTLQFEKAGKVAVSLSVQGIGASAPGAGGGAMMMMKKDPDHSQHGAGK
ncbi:MAG: copper chaperone PCu(A)C [Rhizobiales bacterium]|nr:copper chaperone PCu(A)C [Hyphomicrobiales bacterium]